MSEISLGTDRGPHDLARSYWDSEESRDLDRILTHFRPDASWVGPTGDFKGTDEFRTFYEGSSAAFPGLSVTIVEVLGDIQRAAVRWEAALTDPDGRIVSLTGVNLMTWENGLITDLRTFYDQAALPGQWAKSRF